MSLSIIKKAKTFRKNDRGVTMLEYGVLAALICAVCITIVGALGTDINAKFTAIDNAIKAAAK
jgi:pilus assembly protein Flp/PilA